MIVTYALSSVLVLAGIRFGAFVFAELRRRKATRMIAGPEPESWLFGERNTLVTSATQNSRQSASAQDAKELRRV